jgi:hypothetical protein
VAAYELKHKRARVEDEDKKTSQKVNALLKDLVRTYVPHANAGSARSLMAGGTTGTLQSGMSVAESTTNASELL